MSHETCTTFSLGDLVCPELGTDLLLSIRPILISYIPNPFGSTLAMLGFAAVISPVSFAAKAKSDELMFDLTLTQFATFLRNFLNFLKIYL